MEKEILLLVGGIIGAAISATISYFLTKKREREAEWRKEKMKYYIEFVNSLSGTIAGESSDEGQIRYSKACNDIQLFAPKDVINSMQKYRLITQASDQKLIDDEHDTRLTNLLFAMRKDLNIKPKDRIGDWEAKLWSSGINRR